MKKTTAASRRAKNKDTDQDAVVVSLRADAQGRVSPQLINAATRHFDLEAVTKLVLQRMAIRTTQGIGACVNLEELDLTDNVVDTLVDLSEVKGLKKLVLTQNKLASLDALSTGTWPAIEHVFVQANAIATVDALCIPSLARLGTLKSLYLKNVDGSQPNPVCKLHGDKYRDAALRALPALRNLDGERLRDIRLANERAAQAAAYNQAARDEAHYSSSSSGRSWMSFPDVDDGAGFRGAAEALKALLGETRALLLADDDS